MKELEQFLENELNGLVLKKADWGHLTIEDDSRERTLLEVKELVKKLLPVEEKQMINFHIEVMKAGLIEEGDEKWSDSYEPKIREVAENYFRQHFR